MGNKFSEPYIVETRGYDVLTKECKERQAKATGIMKLVIERNDIEYICRETHTEKYIEYKKYILQKILL